MTERARRGRLTWVGAAAVVIILVGCGKADTAEISSTQTAAPSATATAAGVEVHNNADVWFVRHMIPHHLHEIEISDIVLDKRDVAPRVTELATTIKAARTSAIQQMRNWLSRWGVTTTPADDTLPDQLAARELQALREAGGADADRMFLTQMIAHHGDAISLAQTEIEEGQYPPTVAMARVLARTLQLQVDTMKDMLGSL